MTTTTNPTARTDTTKQTIRRRRPTWIGLAAGTIGLGCCVYPVVLVMLGLASASTAVGLGNSLYSEWGWAFRLAGVAFAAGALLYQRSCARSCDIDQRPNLTRSAGWGGGRGGGDLRAALRSHHRARRSCLSSRGRVESASGPRSSWMR